jgi:hypothetical protein
MKIVFAGFVLGLACLFVFSITWGNKVLSKLEPRSVSENRLEKQSRPGQVSLAEKESRKKKLRLLLNPFDLANGLTFQEIDDIRQNPNTCLFAFLYLVGALWMARGLRWSRSRS